MELCMIESFKNFERLRYRLSNDMRELASNEKTNSDNLKEQISNTVFATIFSAFITEIAFKNNGTDNNFCILFKQITVFVIVYVVTYVIYNFFYGKILSIWEKRKIHVINRSMDVMIQVQKDFDNIACDSILVAQSYKKAFKDLENHPESNNFRIFYYYEIMHYLDSACEKTKELVENKKDCIRTMDEALGVDIYRVINIKDIMLEIDSFLDNEFENVCGGNIQKEAIEYQRKQIKGKIEYIKKNIA